MSAHHASRTPVMRIYAVWSCLQDDILFLRHNSPSVREHIITPCLQSELSSGRAMHACWWSGLTQVAHQLLVLVAFNLPESLPC